MGAQQQLQREISISQPLESFVGSSHFPWSQWRMLFILTLVQELGIGSILKQFWIRYRGFRCIHVGNTFLFLGKQKPLFYGSAFKPLFYGSAFHLSFWGTRRSDDLQGIKTLLLMCVIGPFDILLPSLCPYPVLCDEQVLVTAWARSWAHISLMP